MSLEEIRVEFAELRQRDALVWNFMIRAHVRHGQSKEAVQLFEQMQQSCVFPDRSTFVNLLCACANQAVVAEGKRLHTRILGSGFGIDIIVGTALLNMYGKCGTLKDARRTFDEISCPDVVAWNAMIAVHANLSLQKDTLQFFHQMQSEAVMPDKVTFISIVSACARQAALVEGKRMHSRVVVSGDISDNIVRTSLINMYGKAGRLADAWLVFETMYERDAVSWNAMIAAHTQQCDQGMDPLDLFGKMQREAVMPDKVTFLNTISACITSTTVVDCKQIHARIMGWQFKIDLKIKNALLNMYGKCRCVGAAGEMFATISERDLYSWNAMMAAYAEGGQTKDAFRLFYQMHQEGVMPDNITFVSMLSACSSWTDLAEGKRLHACITSNGFASDIAVGTALVNMYSKCGSLEDTKNMFDEMPKKDAISWTAMIAAYAQHGQGKTALQIFDQMKREGWLPNKVTFLTILSACCHAGLVEEGCHFFTAMSQEHGISPTVKHYNCIADLLGKAGRLDEAEKLIHSMPFHPTAVSWTSLMGACKNQDDMDRGVHAAEHLLKVESEDAASYVMLSNIYAAVGSRH